MKFTLKFPPQRQQKSWATRLALEKKYLASGKIGKNGAYNLAKSLGIKSKSLESWFIRRHLKQCKMYSLDELEHKVAMEKRENELIDSLPDRNINVVSNAARDRPFIPDPNHYPKETRYKVKTQTISWTQLLALEKVYEHFPKPSTEMLTKVSKKLQLDRDKLKKWFIFRAKVYCNQEKIDYIKYRASLEQQGIDKDTDVTLHPGHPRNPAASNLPSSENYNATKESSPDRPKSQSPSLAQYPASDPETEPIDDPLLSAHYSPSPKPTSIEYNSSTHQNLPTFSQKNVSEECLHENADSDNDDKPSVDLTLNPQCILPMDELTVKITRTTTIDKLNSLSHILSTLNFVCNLNFIPSPNLKHVLAKALGITYDSVDRIIYRIQQIKNPNAHRA